jgi:hypothetical protein
MGVSRQTFGLIVARARKKIAEALTHGKAICIEGAEAPALPEQQESGCGRSPRGHGRHGRGCQ